MGFTGITGKGPKEATKLGKIAAAGCARIAVFSVNAVQSSMKTQSTPRTLWSRVRKGVGDPAVPRSVSHAK